MSSADIIISTRRSPHPLKKYRLVMASVFGDFSFT
jgi:hypothetical protein